MKSRTGTKELREIKEIKESKEMNENISVNG